MARKRLVRATPKALMPAHLLFFTYTPSGLSRRGEQGRRTRASALVTKAGGTCEIFRIAWGGYDMVSIVRGLSTERVMALAAEINGWGAVHTTVVTTSTIDIRK